jgi:hypothetical protein
LGLCDEAPRQSLRLQSVASLDPAVTTIADTQLRRNATRLDAGATNDGNALRTQPWTARDLALAPTLPSSAHFLTPRPRMQRLDELHAEHGVRHARLRRLPPTSYVRLNSAKPRRDAHVEEKNELVEKNEPASAKNKNGSFGKKKSGAARRGAHEEPLGRSAFVGKNKKHGRKKLA